jgi:serine/threonine protein kinase
MVTGFPVAVKVMERKMVGDIMSIFTVMAEGAIGAMCPESKHVVQTLATIHLESHDVIVSELCDKGNLHRLLTAEPGGLGVDLGLKTVYQILLGLNELHSAGIAWQDGKPENVMITKENLIAINDFGLAVPYSNPEKARMHPCGTPQYMPPEFFQQEMGHLLDPFKADMFAVGLIAHEVIFGYGARQRSSYIENVGDILTSDQVNPDYPGLDTLLGTKDLKLPVNKEEYPAELLLMLARCLSVRPEMRPTVAELLELRLFNESKVVYGNGRRREEVDRKELEEDVVEYMREKLKVDEEKLRKMLLADERNVVTMNYKFLVRLKNKHNWEKFPIDFSPEPVPSNMVSMEVILYGTENVQPKSLVAGVHQVPFGSDVAAFFNKADSRQLTPAVQFNRQSRNVEVVDSVVAVQRNDRPVIPRLGLPKPAANNSARIVFNVPEPAANNSERVSVNIARPQTAAAVVARPEISKATRPVTATPASSNAVTVDLTAAEIYKRLEKVLPGYKRIVGGVEADVQVKEAGKTVKAYVRVLITSQGKGRALVSVSKRHGPAKPVEAVFLKVTQILRTSH